MPAPTLPRHSARSAALLILALLLLPARARAAEPTNVEQTFFPDKDGFFQSTNENNKGTGKSIRIGSYPEEKTEYRLFIHFDLATLKKQAVTSAVLRMHPIDGHHGQQPKFIRIHPLYRDWDETKFQSIMATKDEAWITPMGDFLPQACGGGKVPTGYSGESIDKWYSFDITRCVQMWQNGTLKNYGLIVMLEQGSDIWITFDSRESDKNRPQLLISYGQPIGVSDGTILSGTGIADFGPQPIFHPIIATTELYKGVVGEEYKKLVMVKGGEKPYKFELMGMKPDGFSIDESTGLISGTATKPVSTMLRVKVTGADRKSSMQNLKLVIDKAPDGAAIKIPGDPKPADPKPADPKPTDDDKPVVPPDLPQDDG